MGFFARQPILDREERTYGYELLYRAASHESFARIQDPDVAARSVLDDLLVAGVDNISGGRQIFLNCTRELLVARQVSLIPERIVVEVLETIKADAEVLDTIAELKKAGFLIALDDFVPDDSNIALLPYADIVKIDLRANSLEDCAEIVRICCRDAIALAEKVETRAEYNAARAMGFKLFQGYFFSEPMIQPTMQLPPLKTNYFRLLAAVCKPEIDFAEVEAIIKSDVSLCYKLLRYLNSVAFSLDGKITSLRQGLILMGEKTLRNWLAVSAVNLVSTGKPSELLATALLRGRFCELLAPLSGCAPYDLFITGLFSLMEGLLNVPLPKILEHVQISSTARSALLGEPSRLRGFYDLAASYCWGDWEKFNQLCESLRCPPDSAANIYLEAVGWVKNVTEAAPEATTAVSR